MSRLINPPGMPEPVGFSHAVETTTGRTLYVAGQTGQRSDVSIVDGGLVDQFRQALVNVATCMEEAGFPPESLVRLVIYTTDLAAYRENLKPLGRVYREVFGRHYPGIALLGISELFDPAAKVELVATAFSPS